MHLKQASLETLIDSPVLSGQFMRKSELTQREAFAHEMDVAAESESDLPSSQEVVERYGRLIEHAGGCLTQSIIAATASCSQPARKGRDESGGVKASPK